jgi:membrane protease subunit HflC
MERDVLAASSVGYRSAQEIKGKADAKAAAIYAAAYGSDAEFYQFTKSMEALGASLDEKSSLVLSTGSDLLKYLKSDGGR